MSKWQVVETSSTGIVRHEPLHDTRRQAEEAAADLANQLGDNDPTEIYAEETEEAL